MKSVILSTAAAIVALSATGALAENAVGQSRARLAAEFAKADVAEARKGGRAERQVSSGIRLGIFDSIFGDIRLGVADSSRVDAGSFSRSLSNRNEVRAGR